LIAVAATVAVAADLSAMVSQLRNSVKQIG